MITLQKAWEKVNELSQDCWDALIPVKEVRFDSLEEIHIGSDVHRLEAIAQRQAAYRLGIPIQYLKKCPEEVQAYNLNHWLEKERNDDLFFRFDGNEVRALFTPKYTPIDNKEILKKLESLDYDLETKVQFCLDEEFMNLSIPDEKKTFNLKGNDRMQPGITLANSEVGLSCLSVSAFMLRLVCTNGLISSTDASSSYRHISQRILEEFPVVLSNAANELDLQRRQWHISLDSPVANPDSTLNSFNRQFQLNEAEQEAVKWAWPQEMGDTMFHIVNTYTRAAQLESLTAESSYRLQKTGGKILALLN